MKKYLLLKRSIVAVLAVTTGLLTWGSASASPQKATPEKKQVLRDGESTVIIEESFSTGFPEGWFARDIDGNGKTFTWTKWQNHGTGPDIDYSGTGGSMTSDSFISSEKPLSNWLIAPRLNLPNGGEVSFWTTTYSSQFPAEKYSVCYSTTGSNPEDFIELMTETLTKERVMVWKNFTLQLPAGTKYVAFHHHDCQESGLSLDDVKISGVGGSLANDLPTYVVSVEETERGTVQVKDSKDAIVENLNAVKEGSKLRITATANEGFNYRGLKINGIAINDFYSGDPYEFNIAGNTTIAAVFKKRTHSIRLPWQVENGKIELEGLGDQQVWEVEEDTEVTVKPIPNPGYKVGEVRLDEEVLAAPYTFILKKSVSINVTFVPESQEPEEGVATLSENFDGADVDFSNLPQGWEKKSKSEPDDPYTGWGYYNAAAGVHSGRASMRSYGSSNTKYSNLLITPRLALKKESFLSFFIKTGSPNQTVPYKVLGSKSDTEIASFTEILFTESIPYSEKTYAKKVVKVPADIKYIAFVHFAENPVSYSTDLLIDDIVLQEEPIAITYEVVLLEVENGTIAIEGKTAEELKAIPEGTELTVVATPNENYELRSVFVNQNAIEAPYRFTVKERTEVGATFAKKVTTYPVTIQVKGKGFASIEGYTTDMLKAVPEGTTLTIKAQPSQGHTLKSITVNGVALPSNGFTFTVSKATEVIVTFEKEVATYPVTLQIVGEGTASIENYTDDMLKAVPEGTTLTIKAQPKQGHLLKSITVNGTALPANTLTFKVEKATTVIITFEKQIVTYTVTLAPTENGTISIKNKTAEELKAIAEGTDLIVEVTPLDKYELSTLTANNVDIKATRTFKVTANTEVKATFKLIDAIEGINGNKATIYPNPAQDFVAIEGIEANTLVRLTTMDGRVIAEALASELGVARFNVSGLARGNYLLVVAGKAQVIVLK